MKEYSVKQLAELSGVSVRTLHYYDEIGLLTPMHIGENRYRYYGENELYRLQQILLYREFGISLTEIASFLDAPDFDALTALIEHKARLKQEAERYRRLVLTIDRTIENLKGDCVMKHSELYQGFSKEIQESYEKQLIDQHGPDMRESIETSKKAVGNMSEADMAEAMQELEFIETGLAEQMKKGTPATSGILDPLLERHQAYIAKMWGKPCPPEAYSGLGDMYLSHSDFRKRYETIAEGLTDYIAIAIKSYAKRLPNS